MAKQNKNLQRILAGTLIAGSLLSGGCATTQEYGAINPVIRDTYQNKGLMEKEGDIYVVDLGNSSDIKNITNTPDIIEEGTWFNNDGRIVFSAKEKGRRNLYLIDSEGKNKIQISND